MERTDREAIGRRPSTFKSVPKTLIHSNLDLFGGYMISIISVFLTIFYLLHIRDLLRNSFEWFLIAGDVFSM